MYNTLRNIVKEYLVAIYIRLSKEDDNLGESESIGNQKILLTKYVKEQGYALVDIYIDDGYTGTNFNRPNFQRMLNDIENGRVAKPDPEILKRIAEELELSLQQLLKAAGYNEVMSWFSHDEFKNKSTKDLKNTIEECRLFKYDILDWDANKRKKALKIMQNLNEIKLGLRLIKEDAETDYTIDKALEDIDKEIEELKDIATKYDYSKLPKDI